MPLLQIALARSVDVFYSHTTPGHQAKMILFDVCVGGLLQTDPQEPAKTTTASI
jgi:hypothetical protein